MTIEQIRQRNEKRGATIAREFTKLKAAPLLALGFSEDTPKTAVIYSVGGLTQENIREMLQYFLKSMDRPGNVEVAFTAPT